ncbi:NAD(+) diphosphatase [Polymorphospora sp. NPDC051019]|uniref:NAD(+) diphosphatase n=1 Tax=Polymorphospora sp. NPDC051019 TaxID=3155725 RepID=UPI003448AD9B
MPEFGARRVVGVRVPHAAVHPLGGILGPVEIAPGPCAGTVRVTAVPEVAPPVVASGDRSREIAAAAGESVLLGLDDGTPVFAADLSAADEPAALRLGAAETSGDLRTVAADLPHPQAATLAYARGLLHWNRHTRYCGLCGSPARSAQAGHVRVCTGPECGRLSFPRIEPAVIALIERPGAQPRCLLARHHGAGPDNFSLLAGFAEIGESLEGTVRREAAEEAGVTVGPVTYQGSQGWPFPSGLMIGFVGQALDDRIDVDGAELLEARWFTRGEVIERIVDGPGAGPADSIGGWLLRSWAGLDPTVDDRRCPGGADAAVVGGRANHFHSHRPHRTHDLCDAGRSADADSRFRDRLHQRRHRRCTRHEPDRRNRPAGAGRIGGGPFVDGR